MPQLTTDQRKFALDAARWFKQTYLPERYALVYQQLPGAWRIAELDVAHSDAEQLLQHFENCPLDDIPDELIPCLKRALIAFRRNEASEVDSMKERTTNPSVIGRLEERLTPLNNLLRETWLGQTNILALPRSADLLSIRDIEANQKDKRLADREYDEKFHILQAPKLFLSDLCYYRQICEERGTEVIAAYIDVDDFKRLNTRYGEVEIDRSVLPRFMHILERHTFQHGFVYRYGGDEYVVVLPNLSRSLAFSFLNSLRIAIAEARYPGIEDRTTVSIGFCCVDPDCLLTDREIEARANQAKNFAKANGKNCIATYKGSLFEAEDLFVIK